jgi:uncharacterized phage infection (PIP) family protein YhgE
MFYFNRNNKINPKISIYIKEQTNKSLEKYLILFKNIKEPNLFYINTI